MRRFAVPALFVLVFGLVVAFRYAPRSGAGSVEGVWKAVESTVTNADSTTTNQLTQPNLTFFTKGHYASLRVGGQGERPALPDNPTDEQLLAALRRFFANAGTYTVSGNELTTKVILSRSPNATAEQMTGTSTFEVDGDVLYRTFTNRQTGGSMRVKYIRLE